MASKNNEEIRSELQALLAADGNLDGCDLRVYLYLSSKLNFKISLEVSQQEIGDKLGKSKEQVSRSIRRLKDNGVLVEGERIGRSYQYKLNPNYSKASKTTR
jgi:biotin operon repressor